jgi:hypothetical protein
MDTNIAAWMIGGGPRIEDPHAQREREQLHAFLESQRIARHEPGAIERIRQLVRRSPAAAEPVCCPA